LVILSTKCNLEQLGFAADIILVLYVFRHPRQSRHDKVAMTYLYRCIRITITDLFPHKSQENQSLFSQRVDRYLLFMSVEILF